MQIELRRRTVHGRVLYLFGFFLFRFSLRFPADFSINIHDCNETPPSRLSRLHRKWFFFFLVFWFCAHATFIMPRRNVVEVPGRNFSPISATTEKVVSENRRLSGWASGPQNTTIVEFQVRRGWLGGGGGRRKRKKTFEWIHESYCNGHGLWSVESLRMAFDNRHQQNEN